MRADMDTQLKKAVAEGIRWVAPIGTQGRSPIKDVEIRGVRIPAGAAISAVIASANHDEDVYPGGDVFNMTREHKQLATFGFGSRPASRRQRSDMVTFPACDRLGR